MASRTGDVAPWRSEGGGEEGPRAAEVKERESIVVVRVLLWPTCSII